MPDHFDSDLALLESVTAHTLLLTEEAKDDKVGEAKDIVKSTFDDITKGLKKIYDDITNPIDSEIPELAKRANDYIITSECRIDTYQNIQNIHKTEISLNATALFDFTVAEITKHSEHPDEPLEIDELMGRARAEALAQCTGERKDSVSISEFKDIYQNTAFGSRIKRLYFPVLYELTLSAKKIPLLIDYIDNRLIEAHIDHIKDYEAEAIEKFEKLAKNDKTKIPILGKYAICIRESIYNTMQIYRIMRETYTILEREYVRIYKHIIANGMRKISNFNETVERIKDSISLLKNSTVLNESAGDQNKKISESLITFMDKFKDSAETSKQKRISSWTDLNSKLIKATSDDVFNTNTFGIELPMFTRINEPLDITFINNILESFAGNLLYLDRIDEHSDKYALTRKGILAGIFTFIKIDSNNDPVNEISTAVKTRVLGEYKPCEPKLDIIVNNLMQIPGILATIENSIDEIERSICGKVERILSGKKYCDVADKTILTAYLSYLAMVLNIYDTYKTIGICSVQITEDICRYKGGSN